MKNLDWIRILKQALKNIILGYLIAFIYCVSFNFGWVPDLIGAGEKIAANEFISTVIGFIAFVQSFLVFKIGLGSYKKEKPVLQMKMPAPLETQTKIRLIK